MTAAVPVVSARIPVQPFPAVAETRVSGLTYGFPFLEAASAQFTLSANDANFPEYAAHYMAGAMITIEREDQLFPFAGFVTSFEAQSGGGEAVVTAQDHMAALFAKARTPFHWETAKATAGDHLYRVLRDADGRAHPPLLCGFDISDAGVGIEYEPRGEPLDAFIARMVEAGGGEWQLVHDVGPSVVTRFRWRDRIGNDNRQNVTWVEGKHFSRARYRQFAANFVDSSVAIGALGDTEERVGANATGGDEGGFLRVAEPAFREGLPWPPLFGERVLIMPNVGGGDALAAAARRLLDPPEFARETVSFTLSEGEIDLAYPPVPGDTVMVRFEDIALGKTVERPVRILGMQITPDDGTVEVETQVLGRPADSAQTT